MNTCYKTRQEEVLKLLPENIDAFLVTNLSNIRYLSGFTGSAGALLLEKAIETGQAGHVSQEATTGPMVLRLENEPKNHVTFFTDFRYQEQSTQEIGENAVISVYKTSAMEAVADFIKVKQVANVGIESGLTVGQRVTLEGDEKRELEILKSTAEIVRQVKDPQEIKLLRKAFKIADKGFKKLLKFLRPGRTEKDVAARLEYLCRKAGSEGASFSTIIASGEHSSCPHAHPTDKKLKKGEMLKIDFGAMYGGYHSDMTRTVFLGKADKKFKEIYGIVHEAQSLAIAAIKPGADCKAIDKIARDHIASKGYGDKFGHGLGHALGLDIHESPSFSTKATETLKEGMVLTVEPGIYIPGWGGVRIEDVFVVTAKGPVKLTHTDNTLLEIRKTK